MNDVDASAFPSLRLSLTISLVPGAVVASGAESPRSLLMM